MLWTANTERYSEVIEGLNDTTDNLMAAIQRGEAGARWSAQGKGSRLVAAGEGAGQSVRSLLGGVQQGGAVGRNSCLAARPVAH